MATNEEKLLRRIKKKGRGWCFSPRDFIDLADHEAVWKGLARLEKKGVILRLGRGLYYYPREHEELGTLSPTPEAVASAMAQRDGTLLQPSGAYAANMLGLSEQVPAKLIFMTDGPDRKVRIGKREIILKNTVPRNMATAGTASGLVIQGLRHIGTRQINEGHVERLRIRLNRREREQLWRDRLYAPAWLHPILKKIAEVTDD